MFLRVNIVSVNVKSLTQENPAVIKISEMHTFHPRAETEEIFCGHLLDLENSTSLALSASSTKTEFII